MHNFSWSIKSMMNRMWRNNNSVDIVLQKNLKRLVPQGQTMRFLNSSFFI